MTMTMLRMSRLQIFDMEGFLREYREGTRQSRSLSEFSVLLFSFPVSRVKDARKLSRVATHQILCHLDI
jgi:hypothetical protein